MSRQLEYSFAVFGFDFQVVVHWTAIFLSGEKKVKA